MAMYKLVTNGMSLNSAATLSGHYDFATIRKNKENINMDNKPAFH